MYRSHGAMGEYFAAQSGMGEYFAQSGMGGALVDWAKQEEAEAGHKGIFGLGEFFVPQGASGMGEYFASNGLGADAAPPLSPEAQQNLDDIAVCSTDMALLGQRDQYGHPPKHPDGRPYTQDELIAKCVAARQAARNAPAFDRTKLKSFVLLGAIGATALYGGGRLLKASKPAVWAGAGVAAAGVAVYLFDFK